MEWSADTSAGDWIGERLAAEPWNGTMHAVVPRGFAAYARVFHRPTVAWAVGRAYPTQDEWREMHPDRRPETFAAESTWAEAAAVFGTELHSTAQWNRVVLRGGADAATADVQGAIGPDGREYTAPEEGRLDAAQLAACARHLATHTDTADDVFVALWEGWGGVLGFFGDAPSRALIAPLDEDDPDLFARHAQMLGRSIHDPFNNAFRKPMWQPGLLSDEISQGPRLHLPNRDHVLFHGGISELADPGWARTVPWAERDPEWTHSPSLVWPADQAWMLVTEVDYDSTIVGGSADLVRALCTDPLLEARALREGADLTWDADEVNR